MRKIFYYSQPTDTDYSKIVKAFLSLTKSAYTLWLYFSFKRPSEINQEVAKESFNMCKATYFNAMKELADKGYLKKIDTFTWMFYND